MITPTFNDVLTVYHQEKKLDEETKRHTTVWERTVYEQCYFGTDTVENLNGTTLSQASSYIARIPYKNKKIAIDSGDIVVLGRVADDIFDVQGNRATDIIAKYKPNCFTVRIFKDNTKIVYGSHYKLCGA